VLHDRLVATYSAWQSSEDCQGIDEDYEDLLRRVQHVNEEVTSQISLHKDNYESVNTKVATQSSPAAVKLKYAELRLERRRREMELEAQEEKRRLDHERELLKLEFDVREAELDAGGKPDCVVLSAEATSLPKPSPP